MQIAPPDFDRIFGALADATRRDIVRRAIDGDEGVAELAEHYPMSFAAVQKHVAILERAGWSPRSASGDARSSGPTSRGSASPAACSTSTRSCGAGAIDRMTALVEAEQNTKEIDR